MFTLFNASLFRIIAINFYKRHFFPSFRLYFYGDGMFNISDRKLKQRDRKFKVLVEDKKRNRRRVTYG